ncbi:uncharacterized protein LOC106094294 [Stomoxys calcitrans]|uniref:uncharacterized protein LOC106094294 n=1 Tax=Stomoxys calcitrans TaxID=35570 RepID=UPI0027E36D86|nr:uncharacterized protein LOC106094294 [Stomoxys calcitrans]
MATSVYILALWCLIAIKHVLPILGEHVHNSHTQWFEANGNLYHIEVEPEFTWKESMIHCKKERLNLLRPSEEYHPAQLKEYIKTKFPKYPSFWVQKNATKASLVENLGFKFEDKERRCNKMDNQTFGWKTDKCYNNMGFICERALKNGWSLHRLFNTRYYIMPDSKYTCNEVRKLCSEQNMTLTLLSSLDDNFSLKDYIFINYGAFVTFWLGEQDTTTDCKFWSPLNTNKTEKRGYICEQPVIQSFLTFRHLLLIGCVSVAALIAIIVFVVFKLILRRKVKDMQQNVEKVEKK